ncbi:MAG: NYN domain-containing protein [Spirochaetes bacterium]|nr:NYN domain-containing protein [Spirochaetota bacterium]
MEEKRQMDNIAILWDLENVNPGNNSLFLDRLIEYSEGFGRIVSARAYGNWSNPRFSRLAPSLVRRYFFLVHIPKSRKNSADIGLISDSFELLRLYSHIDTYILVTGDSDFRFLIISLRRAGKKINIVCNTQSASEDLLELADSFIDYRELLAESVDEDEDEISKTAETQSQNGILKKVTKADWNYLLVESIESIVKEKKKPRFSTVKMRMKKYNPNFDLKLINLKQWSDFITGAVKEKYIEIRNERIFALKKFNQIKSPLWIAFQKLIEILDELDPKPSNEYQELSIVNHKLVNKNVYVKMLGFKQFKDFIKAAEARKLVEYKVEGLSHYVKKMK